jgi:hypothetical protein
MTSWRLRACSDAFLTPRRVQLRRHWSLLEGFGTGLRRPHGATKAALGNDFLRTDTLSVWRYKDGAELLENLSVVLMEGISSFFSSANFPSQLLDM